MLRVIDVDEVINIVREKDIIEKNYGQIRENYGTVIINRGEIGKNCKGAVVKQNFGKIKSNDGSIIRDYTNDSMEINQKIDSVIVHKGIKHGIKSLSTNQGMCTSILYSTWMRRKYTTDLKDREWGIDRKVFKGIV